MTKTFSLKFISLFVLMALVSVVHISAQASNNSENQNQSSYLSSEQTSEGQWNNSQSPYWSNSDAEPEARAPSTFGMFVKMLFSLLIIVVLIYVVVRIFKKSTGIADDNDSFLRKVASLSIGAGKSVQIVTLLDRAYLIGVADNSINLLSEIDDKELVDSLNLLADKNQNTNKPRSFADVLEIFTGNGPDSKNAFTGNARHVTDLLRQQRDRFNKGE